MQQQPSLRLIGCSAEAFAHTRDAALAAGMVAFLQKPVTMAALSAALQPVAATASPESANLFERLRVPELVGNARAILARDLPDSVGNLRTAHGASDAAALQHHAHVLHSTALMANDATLAELCRRLERAAAAGGKAEIPAILRELAHHAGLPAE
jgi:two-component system, NarL family, sensor histidine kinase EvgS